MKEKTYYVIVNKEGTILKDTSTNIVLFFEFPIQAQKMIDKQKKGSPYLFIRKWLKKEKEKTKEIIA